MDKYLEEANIAFKSCSVDYEDDFMWLTKRQETTLPFPASPFVQPTAVYQTTYRWFSYDVTWRPCWRSTSKHFYDYSVTNRVHGNCDTMYIYYENTTKIKPTARGEIKLSIQCCLV